MEQSVDPKCTGKNLNSLCSHTSQTAADHPSSMKHDSKTKRTVIGHRFHELVATVHDSGFGQTKRGETQALLVPAQV